MVWTFHDCWAFTAYCTYYSGILCDKWQKHCVQCPKNRSYSWFIDRSRRLYEKKKQLFSGLDLTVITPSQWLADQVNHSFLKKHPVHVIHNGIDLEVFRAVPGEFRRKYGLEDKKIVLGVSDCWDARKGIDIFLELSKRLPENYRIVLVGTDAKLDKLLPENIISIRRTRDQTALAEIYSAADVFVNPTREEVLGLVNIEALACGTPGVTFRSDGSPECYDADCGSVVNRGDVDALEKEIIRICTNHPYSAEACRKRACRFDQNKRYKEYIRCYERVIATGNTKD